MDDRLATNSTLIELHVDDFGKVKDFYGKLGFKIVWERKPEDKKGYLVMQQGNNVLCFWPGNEEVINQDYFKKFPQDTKKGFGVEITIMVSNIEQLFKTASQFANVVDKLKLQPWGLKDFRVEDPFGFYLRFTEPHNILDDKYSVH